MTKIHFYDAERSNQFNELIISKCGYAKNVQIGRLSPCTVNPLHVTCKRCIKIIAPEIKAHFNV